MHDIKEKICIYIIYVIKMIKICKHIKIYIVNALLRNEKF